jgi:hypothetical protein
MPVITSIEGDEGQVWIMMGSRVLMYISQFGSLYVPGDVIAFGNIPPPPDLKAEPKQA